jgi:hypothetical protein
VNEKKRGRPVEVFLELYVLSSGESKTCPADLSYNESYWQTSDYLDYGYWAALKRMGKAQEVTGCFDYELLMPIPYTDIMLNQNLKQNPGY